ncbi:MULTISPECIES: hypothetical protein [Priestia]|uniref:hypothetical protein n=1 Tax=Priestia megaterium TaxID=1404 RepID=UPI0012B89A0B|nr:hypothetical protein [Priestia megaterium]
MKKYNLAGKVTYILGALLFLLGFLVSINKVSYFELVPSLSAAVKYAVIGFALIVVTKSKVFRVQE